MPRKQKDFHYIYKTTCNVTGKYYYGMHSTNNLDDGYMGSGTRISRSIKNHGKENHSIERLEFLENRTKLKEREAEIVNEELIKDPLCMNLQLGGIGGLSGEEHKRKFIEGGSKTRILGKERVNWLRENDKEWTKKWKKALSESQMGRKSTFKGKQHKEESKRKIGLANLIKQKGELNSQFGKCWITNGKESKKIKKGDLIPKGWKLGRKIKI